MIALITGASSGIGAELSKVFAANGCELVLTARSLDRLEQLKNQIEAKYRLKVICATFDLSSKNGSADLFAFVREQKLEIDILVNNAGFGLNGSFVETSLEAEVDMINLNIVALVKLSKFFSQVMATRGHGRILNVASTAAFQPGPLMNVYYATKSFVLSFSEALREELVGTGVTVTTLCPGPTRTEFAKRAGIEGARLFHEGKVSVMSAEAVAQAAYTGVMLGRSIVIPGLGNRIGSIMVRLLPYRFMTKITKALNRVRPA